MGLVLRYARQTRTGKWQYRRRFPTALTDLIQRTEFKRLLGNTEAEALQAYSKDRAQGREQGSEGKQTGLDRKNPGLHWETGATMLFWRKSLAPSPSVRTPGPRGESPSSPVEVRGLAFLRQIQTPTDDLPQRIRPPHITRPTAFRTRAQSRLFDARQPRSLNYASTDLILACRSGPARR